MDISRFQFTSQNVTMLAVFIMVHPEGTHTGIVHRNRQDLFTLDLMWHERLRSELLRDDYPCVVPNLEPEEANDVMGMCRLIEARNRNPNPQRIPYAVGPSSSHFSRDGELILGDGLGLTCSTFVLTVFESAAVPLADLTGWVARSDDDERHHQLLQKMTDGIPNFAPPADPSHVQKVRTCLPCIRVRPEEVAGAALAGDLPADFATAEAAGHLILLLLSEAA
jgi:hypothetical protein